MARLLDPSNTRFVLLSFEGPDAYAQAGGLGVRVQGLSLALAEAGFPVDVFFVGDPTKAGREVRLGGRLTLRRWCQWISRYHPGGVYDGEEEKRADFTRSVPPYLLEQIARPALDEGRLLVVVGEEWHTAEVMCGLSDLLWEAGLRERTVLLWNANNTMGFHRIDWSRLAFTTTITTVSRYMKQLMWNYGVNPLVIPNGIPRRLLHPVMSGTASSLRQSLGRRTVLCKVARWDPDKRWRMGVETVARLKARGRSVRLIARGGVEPHGGEVLDHARSLGLRVCDVAVPVQRIEAYAAAFDQAEGADVLNVTTAVPQPMLRVLYHVSDAVLANSGREPFGLVGLEAMAAGGVAFTGQTGEEYVRHLQNAIALQTDDPDEAAWYVTYLQETPQQERRIRQAARETARRFVWEQVVQDLLGKVEFLAARQGALPRAPDPEPALPALDPPPLSPAPAYVPEPVLAGA